MLLILKLAKCYWISLYLSLAACGVGALLFEWTDNKPELCCPCLSCFFIVLAMHRAWPWFNRLLDRSAAKLAISKQAWTDISGLIPSAGLCQEIGLLLANVFLSVEFAFASAGVVMTAAFALAGCARVLCIDSAADDLFAFSDSLVDGASNLHHVLTPPIYMCAFGAGFAFLAVQIILRAASRKWIAQFLSPNPQSSLTALNALISLHHANGDLHRANAYSELLLELAEQMNRTQDREFIPCTRAI